MRSASSGLSPARSGSKSHSAPICERKPAGSKNEIRRVAVLPSESWAQNCSRPTPPGATTPTPVITVLRTLPRRSRVWFELLSIDVAEVGPRGEGPEVEDDGRVDVAAVHEPMSNVGRNEEPLARTHVVLHIVQPRHDGPT